MKKRITKKQLSGLASEINEALRAKGCNWEVLVTPRFGAVTIDITEAGSGINRSALPFGAVTIDITEAGIGKDLEPEPDPNPIWEQMIEDWIFGRDEEV